MSSKQSIPFRSSHQTPEYISLFPCVLHVPHILIPRFALLLLLLLLLLLFIALCQYLFFTCDHLTYADFLKFLNLHALHNRRLHLDALFFVSVCPGLIRWPSLLDITGIRVLPRNFRNSPLFTATSKNSPSARCVSAANCLCNDVSILSNPIPSSFIQTNSEYFLLLGSSPACG
jgi:hypothetical protein